MRPLVATCAISILLGMPGTAASQAPADEIRGRVKTGQKVSITDDQGREFKGRLSELSTAGLSILMAGERTEIPYDAIVRIDRPHDSLANGALIGLAAGAGLGFAALISEENSACGPEEWFCSDPDGGDYALVTLIMGGLGSAVGVGVDALIRRERSIYRRGGGPRITVSPALGRNARGAALSIAW